LRPNRVKKRTRTCASKAGAAMLARPCEGTTTAVSPKEGCSRQAAPWILAASVLASSMVFIDGSAVNVAVPVLQSDLHTTNAGAQWVIESYALFLSALILVGGSLGDLFGRRRIFLAGIAAFALASLLCGFAQTAGQLIAARAVQGVASALLTPGSLSIIGASFDESRRGKAIGTWSSFTAVTAMAGPLLGGFIVQHASWRWVFFINIPVAAAAIAITYAWVAESREALQGERRIDWLGAVLATISLGCIVYALIESGSSGWSWFTGSCLVAGLVVLAAFIAVEARLPNAMMPLDLFADRNFSAINAQTLLIYGALGGATFFLPFDLIQVQHYSPSAAGAAMLPFIILVSALSPQAGALATRIGAKRPLVVGSAIVALSFVAFAIPSTGGSYWTTFFGPCVLLGLGMSLVVSPLTTTVMTSAGSDRFGIASGVNNAVARTASLVAIAVLGLGLALRFNHTLDVRMASAEIPQAVERQVDAERADLAAARPPENAPPIVRRHVADAIALSYVDGFRFAMVLAALLAIGGMCCAFALENRPAGTAERRAAG
jgi:EmrB/QacA subfamily drug resistance transporter